MLQPEPPTQKLPSTQIVEFERSYLELFWKRQRCLWDNATGSTRRDISLIDEEIDQLVSRYRGLLQLFGRHGMVINAILIREAVDKNPDTALLSSQLDNWDNYRPDNADELDPQKYRLALAQAMKPDVLQLMADRNRLAQELGFGSYPDLVLFTEELKMEPLLGFLKKVVEEHAADARKLVIQYDLTLSTWFTDLDRVGQVSPEMNPDTSITRLLERLGLSHVRERITVVSQLQGPVGYTGVLAVPNDIRILVNPVGSLHVWLTLFHELGHAVAHALNTETGIFATWSGLHDEAMAILIEHLAPRLLLGPQGQKAARELFLLESIRCALSALFEFDLWQQPSAAELLYIKYYKLLGLFDPADLWALDSFRSIDPVYIQNYVVGAQFADKAIAYLERKFGSQYELWGGWLQTNFYADGRKRSLQEKGAILN
jgi:hypothetical protein